MVLGSRCIGISLSGAILGNYLGSLIVERITDNHFKRIGRYAVMVIGLVYLAKGIAELT